MFRLHQPRSVSLSCPPHLPCLLLLLYLRDHCACRGADVWPGETRTFADSENPQTTVASGVMTRGCSGEKTMS